MDDSNFESLGEGRASKGKAEGGAKFDEGKPDLSLLPPDALIEVTRAYDYGVLKYGRNNWRRGIKFNKVYAGILRHLLAWQKGEEYNVEENPDGRYKHLAAAAWGCLTLLEYTRTNEFMHFDDRIPPWSGGIILPPEQANALINILEKQKGEAQ